MCSGFNYHCTINNPAFGNHAHRTVKRIVEMSQIKWFYQVVVEPGRPAAFDVFLHCACADRDDRYVPRRRIFLEDF